MGKLKGSAPKVVAGIQPPFNWLPAPQGHRNMMTLDLYQRDMSYDIVRSLLIMANDCDDLVVEIQSGVNNHHLTLSSEFDARLIDAKIYQIKTLEVNPEEGGYEIRIQVVIEYRRIEQISNNE
jgi:hypothetical protein